jgi:hypothetical protein
MDGPAGEPQNLALQLAKYIQIVSRNSHRWSRCVEVCS